MDLYHRILNSSTSFISVRFLYDCVTACDWNNVVTRKAQRPTWQSGRLKGFGALGNENGDPNTAIPTLPQTLHSNFNSLEVL